MIRLQLIAERKHVLRSLTFLLPTVEINALGSSIHHEIDRRSTTEHASHRNNCLTTSKVFRGSRFIELVEQSQLPSIEKFLDSHYSGCKIRS
jgi:hypothetical protein